MSRSAKTIAAAALPPVDGSAPIWVFGGASGRSYSDNAAVLHAEACDRRPDVLATWTINPDSPDLPAVESVGPVAMRGSLAAHRLAAGAEAIFFSHGVHDVPGLLWNRRALRVRLGHGLTAFGRTKGRLPRSTRRMVEAVDLAPVASRMEQDFKAEWGFPRSKLPITGLPRWDAMLRAQASEPTARERPLILYAPTSRPWHTEADAQPTGALGPMYAFVNGKQIREGLAAGSFDLAIYFHQITRFRFGAMNWVPEGAITVNREAELPRLIAQSSLVVSDYSSILWDALYLDKPVVFFQFDREEHLQRRGSYLDLRAPLFGPNVDTAGEALEAVDEAIDDGFAQRTWRDARRAWQREAFAFRDDGNAQRVLEAVDERIGNRRG